MTLQISDPREVVGATPAWQYGEAGHAMTPGALAAWTFTGTLTGATISGHIYVPTTYDPDDTETEHPICVCMPGKDGTSLNMAQNLVPDYEDARAASEIGTMILVFVGFGNTWYEDDVDGTPKIRTQLVQEVLPHFRMHTRCIPGRSGLCLFGMSMGGKGAIETAFANPNLACAVNIWTAPFIRVGLLFNGNTPFEVEPPLEAIYGTEAAMTLKSAEHFANLNRAAIIASGLESRWAYGTTDANPAGPAIPDFVTNVLNATEPNIPHTLVPLVNGTHSLPAYVAADARGCWRFLAQALANAA